MAEEDSKKRLGRGLAALIGEIDTQTSSWQDDGSTRADRKIPIEYVQANVKNPRSNFDPEELDDLSRSIKEHGIVQPILVRTMESTGVGDSTSFEIIAGERRWRAAQLAGLHEVPIIIRDVDDRQALELAIIENVQRADLNALEEAAGYQQLIKEHGYTQADLGKVIGKSRSHVANTLRLMKLPDGVRAMIGAGQLSAGHARALITSQDPEALAKNIIKNGLSVRQAESLAQNEGAGSQKTTGKKKRAAEKESADIKALEQQLEDLLGLKVSIGFKPDGSGELKIKYKTLEQLDSVCRNLQQGAAGK
ncbi:MAG: ParB/RepB/Spo0J family partition protein [Pseudomonadota bacterium]